MPDKYVETNINVPNIHTQQQQQHIQHNRRGLHSAYKRERGLNELRKKKKKRRESEFKRNRGKKMKITQESVKKGKRKTEKKETEK